MEKDRHFLIISDNENSDIVRIVSSMKIIPIIRKTVLTALSLLRHHEITAIVIDKEYENVDALEFILNARDVDREVPIFVPEFYFKNEDWSILRNFGKIVVYSNDKQLLNNTIK